MPPALVTQGTRGAKADQSPQRGEQWGPAPPMPRPQCSLAPLARSPRQEAGGFVPRESESLYVSLLGSP